jgi:hypothetical protein
MIQIVDEKAYEYVDEGSGKMEEERVPKGRLKVL